MDSIRILFRALRVSSRDSERQFGLTAAQLFVLQKLIDGAKLSINELAERTFTHQSSVSVVVGRLAERGLVKREISREDGRRMEISLTSKGAALLARAPRAAQDEVLDAIGRLSEPEQRKLATLLTKIIPPSQAPAPLFFEDDDPPDARIRT